MNTPVVLMVYNRPEATQRMIDSLRAVAPARILVVGDGPRRAVPEDQVKVGKVRALFDSLPWPCEIERNWSDVNLGCRRRVTSGLDWAFTLVDEAIVLEDDCIPDASFFPFCGELLERYRQDARVLSISGVNYLPGACASSEPSYYFSRYNHCWGWATWKRAWALYDDSLEFTHAPEFGRFLRQTLGSWRAAMYWKYIFRAVEVGKRDSWAYRWTLSGWRRSGVAIIPRQSLVTNIGLNGAGTHTSSAVYRLQPCAPMKFPLVHPPEVHPGSEFDRRVEDTHFSRNLTQRLRWIYRKLRGLAARRGRAKCRPGQHAPPTAHPRVARRRAAGLQCDEFAGCERV